MELDIIETELLPSDVVKIKFYRLVLKCKICVLIRAFCALVSCPWDAAVFVYGLPQMNGETVVLIISMSYCTVRLESKLKSNFTYPKLYKSYIISKHYFSAGHQTSGTSVGNGCVSPVLPSDSLSTTPSLSPQHRMKISSPATSRLKVHGRGSSASSSILTIMFMMKRIPLG